MGTEGIRGRAARLARNALLLWWLATASACGVPLSPSATPQSATSPAAIATSPTASPSSTATPEPASVDLPLVGGAWRGGTPTGPASGQGVPASLAAQGTAALSPSLIPAAPACANLVHREGDHLVVNGQTWSFVGFNLTSLMDSGLPETEIPSILDTLANWGVTMVRTWVLPGRDLDRLERILDLARPRGLRFIVTLQDYYHYKDMRWFTTTYKTEDLPHIEEVVTRFRERPEVAIWEVMNEPWCGADGEVTNLDCYAALQAWAEDTTGLIRSLDPCRPISLGLMGARHLEIELKAYRALSAIDTVDILSMHRVPGDWYSDPKELDVARELGKPIMLGEVAVIGYDERCQQLGPFVVPERARLVAADMQQALDRGLAGYMLWEYAPGTVTGADGQPRYFCSIYGYDRNDPVGPLIRALDIPRIAITP